MNDIEKSLADFILNTLHEGKSDLKLDAGDDLMESGVIDSMGVMEIATFIEEQYGAHVDDDEITLDNFSTVANIAALVSRKLG